MAQGLTLEQLQGMGAKPAPTSGGGLTLAQIQAQQNQTPAVNHLNGFSVIDSLSNGIQNFFPGKELGHAVGSSLYDIGSAGKQALSGNFKGAMDTLLIPPDPSVSPEKVVGDVINSVALPASLALPGISGILKTAGQFGALSTVTGAANSMTHGNDPKTVVKDAFYSGLTGLGTGAVVGGINKAIQTVVDKGPEALYNNSLKVLQKVKTAGKSPAEFLADEGTWGSLGTIYKSAQEGIQTENNAIASKLAPLEGGTDYQTILSKASEKLSKSLGSVYSGPEIEKLLGDVPIASLRDTKEGLDWTATDKLRSQLGALIGDSKWLSTTPSPTVKAAQAVYGALADSIKSVSGTTEEFARLSKWIQTSKSTSRAIDLADSKFGLGLYDLISAGSGIVAGGLSGEDVGTKIKNAAIGGASALALERGINSPALKTGIAQLLQHVDKIPTDAAGRISKTIITQLIGKLIPQLSE